MNPYKVLNIDRNAAKADIIRAVTLAMKEREYSGKEIALAQQKLMDPVSKGAEEFISFIDLRPFSEPLKEKLSIHQEHQSPEINEELTLRTLLFPPLLKGD